MLRRWLLVIALAVLAPGIGGAAEGAGAPKTAADYNAQGVEFYKAQDWDSALGCFLKAYELAPGHQTVRTNLCNSYQAVANEFAKRSDYASAAEHLEQAISVAPENPLPLVQLGACYLRLGSVRYAIYRLEEAIDLAPENTDAHDLLGDAYYRDGDIPSALVQWLWVSEVAPKRKGLSEKIEKARREEAVENGYNRRSSRHFQVRYAKDTSRADLRLTLKFLEDAYLEIGRRFGGVHPEGPILVRVYTAEDFSKATLLGEHVGAVYDGTIRLPIADKTGKTLNQAELKRRLFHEYTHVVVRHIVGDSAPWWLNEGLAETFSNELNPTDLAILQAAYRDKTCFSVAELEEHQLMRLEPDALLVAYLQSHATMRYLWTRFGQPSLVKMMTLLADGTEPEEALRRAYGRTYLLLDKEVAQEYRGNGR